MSYLLAGPGLDKPARSKDIVEPTGFVCFAVGG